MYQHHVNVLPHIQDKGERVKSVYKQAAKNVDPHRKKGRVEEHPKAAHPLEEAVIESHDEETDRNREKPSVRVELHGVVSQENRIARRLRDRILGGDKKASDHRKKEEELLSLNL